MKRKTRLAIEAAIKKLRCDCENLPVPCEKCLLISALTDEENAQSITVLEMTHEQREFAERAAQALGFTQTAYTSHSLPGLYCLPDRQTQKKGVLIQTQEYGLVMFADLEDLNLHDMANEERTRLECARLIKAKAKEIV